MSVNSHISYFALTDFRGDRRRFGIRQGDRLFHIWVVGQTGVGKSTLLENLVWQDIQSGRGLVLLDPHGDLVTKVIEQVPPQRRSDLLYFDATVADPDFGFNPLDRVPPDKLGLAAGGVLDAFRKLWPDSWGPRLEYVLRNAIFALLEQPQANLGDVLKLLEEKGFREAALRHITNKEVRRFWGREFPSYPERLRAETISPIQNKVGAVLTDPRLQAILTSDKPSLRLRRVMDEGKILLVNLAKGRIGEDSASLLGALLVARLNLAGLSRAELDPSKRRPFFCYLDEFQTFTSQTFASMLSELRKYGVGMILAHQYLDQLDLDVQRAMFGNVGTVITFRLGVPDAEVFAREFYPQFGIEDFCGLPNHHIYLKLMIDGRSSRPFSALTLPAMGR